MMNLFYMMDDVLCGSELKAIAGIAGYVILAIKIAAPIILIIVGMFDLTKAATSKDENAIKAAQTALIKKAVSGLAVFFVLVIVSLLMRIIGSNEWKECAAQCLTKPSDCKVSDALDWD